MLHDIPTLLRSWALRLTPTGRRHLALEQGALHSGQREPGLTNIDRTGAVDNDGISVHWYEYGEVTPGDGAVTVLSSRSGRITSAAIPAPARVLRRAGDEEARMKRTRPV